MKKGYGGKCKPNQETCLEYRLRAGFDGFLLKFRAEDGIFMWARQYGSPSNDYIFSLSIGTRANSPRGEQVAYMGGWTEGNWSLGVSAHAETRAMLQHTLPGSFDDDHTLDPPNAKIPKVYQVESCSNKSIWEKYSPI